LLGTFSTGSNAMGVRVRGQIAYVATGNNLTMVNIANPASMILVNSIGVGGTAWNLDVDSTRNLAVVAAGGAGIKLIDVTNPAQPVLKGSLLLSDTRAVAIRNNLVIVADHNIGMRMVNITNQTSPTAVPLNPAQSGNWQALTGLETDIAVSGNFALASEVFFVNGVPIGDISDSTQLQARAILNFPARDDNGMSIAADGSFVYLVTDHSSLDRGGANGSGPRLYIGQYAPRQDLAGVPPTVSIVSPNAGATQYQGAPLTVSVNAVDDVAVASVDFLVNGQVAFSTTSEPYQYTFTLPTGTNSITLGARATDLGNNVGDAANLTINLVPDPLTVVSGLVVNDANTPIVGATVNVPGGLSGQTGADGRFLIANVPTILGNIVASATFTDANNNPLSGSSAPTGPVRGGVTDVGTISLIAAQFETNYGTFITTCDDCNYQRTLPFAFPYYGVNRTTTFVGTNGYVTFNSGDSTYTESLPQFQALPRISAFFDDLIGTGADRGLWINDTLPGRFVVTYDRTQHYCCVGSNTIQIQLFSNGRIVFAYNGITALSDGDIVGLNPAQGANSLAVDYRTNTHFTVPANTAVYEYFNAQSPFNLDHSFVIFTPAAGGYDVRTILPPAPQNNAQVNGGGGGGAVAAARSTRADAQRVTSLDIANAEVIVRSSSNATYVGMTNTDANGNFTLNNVPPGGISVTVQRKGKVIAVGGGVFPGGQFSNDRSLQIELTVPNPPKGQ
jgi:hypothetical protein